MQTVRPARRQGFTLIEIMIVVLLIAILLAIAVPDFLRARETSRSKSCVANLRQIDTAKQQYLLSRNTSSFTNATSTDPTLGGLTPQYVRTQPKCPLGGIYTTGDGMTDPTCSLSSSNAAAYGPAGTFPHYLP